MQNTNGPGIWAMRLPAPEIPTTKLHLSAPRVEKQAEVSRAAEIGMVVGFVFVVAKPSLTQRPVMGICIQLRSFGASVACTSMVSYFAWQDA